MKTLVLGLGNPILTDDGVGVRVAGEVLRALPAGSAVEVGEASVGGLTLMEMLIGYDRVILIDALVHPDEPPGTIHCLSLEDLATLSPTQHSVSAHDTSLVTALEMGRAMGFSLPGEIVTFAVVVENVTDFGEEPTPAVARAIPAATAAVRRQLESWQQAGCAAAGR